MGPSARGAAVSSRVARYVATHEGAHFREVQRRLGLATGQADHHLRRLVRDGVLARTRLGGEVHFFPASRPRADRRPLAALRHPARQAAARALLGVGQSNLRGLAERTGVPETTLLHHLRVLVTAGVAFRVQSGRRALYGASDPAQLRELLGTASAAPARPRRGTLPRPAPR
jgi:predicted transcriptional regulator